MKKILFAFALFFLPVVAFAADMEASGYGTGGTNGVYIDQSTSVNGYPSYYNGAYYLCHMNTAHTWEIGIDGLCIDGSGTAPYYYTDDVAGTPDLVTTWLVNDGASPAGTVVEYDPGSPDPDASSTATTTPINDPNRDFFNGMVLFFGGLWFVVWLFKSRR